MRVKVISGVRVRVRVSSGHASQLKGGLRRRQKHIWEPQLQNRKAALRRSHCGMVYNPAYAHGITLTINYAHRQ